MNEEEHHRIVVMTTSDNERLATLETKQDWHFDRMNKSEKRMEERLGTIEEKLDKLWWKVGVIVGSITLIAEGVVRAVG